MVAQEAEQCIIFRIIFNVTLILLFIDKQAVLWLWIAGQKKSYWLGEEAQKKNVTNENIQKSFTNKSTFFQGAEGLKRGHIKLMCWTFSFYKKKKLWSNNSCKKVIRKIHVHEHK